MAAQATAAASEATIGTKEQPLTSVALSSSQQEQPAAASAGELCPFFTAARKEMAGLATAAQWAGLRRTFCSMSDALLRPADPSSPGGAGFEFSPISNGPAPANVDASFRVAHDEAVLSAVLRGCVELLIILLKCLPLFFLLFLLLPGCTVFVRVH